MGKLLKWAVITFGIAALVRWWRSRGDGPDVVEAAATQEPAPGPADALRQKLAESRSDEPAAAESDASVDERRAEVHAEGRAAIDEMQSSQDDA